jgi:myo-inositol-1(or 4)-monophosphatase
VTPELDAARNAAHKAGSLLRRVFQSGSTVMAETARDIKLAADVEAEGLLLESLRANHPLPVLSEEAGEDAGFDQSARRWVVDPLDGTFNFSRGLPLCCVSVGLCEGETPVAGVIYDFMDDVTYEGHVGVGARRNGAPIRVSATADRAKAVLCTGFPSGGDYGRDSLYGFVRQAQSYKKVRLFGSAALSIAQVAAGVVDAYHEDGIQWWDVAGGLAIVTAAGGRWLSRPGKTRWQREIFAGNATLPDPPDWASIS